VKENFGEKAPYFGPAVSIYTYINLRNGEKVKSWFLLDEFSKTFSEIKKA
jgi:hypothetical protein